jgi:copper(I)-binding protein
VTTPRRTIAVLTASLALGALSACASDSDSDDAAAAETCPITVSDPWVKATDMEMTGAFGVLENTSDAEVVVASASSPQAGMMEIHEVVMQDGEMVMQAKDGGLVVPAGASATLAPGTDHLMLMKLPAPIPAGDEVEITVTCADGGSVTWTSVAKPFEGGEEPYVPAEEGSMDSSESSME